VGGGWTVKITEPGIYPDLPSDVYHAQRDWLSWSQMKYLIPPSTPAHFKASLKAGEERKRHFDLGKVVHTLVLGDGDKFEVVQSVGKDKKPKDAKDYLTVSACQHRDAIYERGNVPILRTELDAALEMAESIKAHKTAHALLTMPGKPEVSLFWIDPDTGVKCRARVDWLPDKQEGRRMLFTDLKTTSRSAAKTEFAKSAADLGYYGQATHYADGIKALGLDDDPVCLFVAVETTAPYAVAVHDFSGREDRRLAIATVEHCRRLYRECIETDEWPAYGQGVIQNELPQWLAYRLADQGITA
jgi:hypothetical protein